jgi:tetratricopeptide (TPR) repeat protein
MARHTTARAPLAIVASAVLSALAVLSAAAVLGAAAAGESIGDLRDRITETERKKLDLVRTLALIAEARGDDEQAIAYTRQAFMLDPADEALARKLLALLRQGERWADMVPIYERLTDEHPGRSQQYLLELSRCHFKTGDAERALEVLEQYRKEYADSEETYLEIAKLLGDNARLADAAAMLEKAIAGRFKKHYKMHARLGLIYIELGRTDKAIETHEAAFDLVKQGTERSAIQSRLISLYKKADRIDEIVAKRRREIEQIDAQLVELYWTGATQHEKAGRLDEAVRFYRNIVALAPDSEKGKAAAAKLTEISPKPEEEET